MDRALGRFWPRAESKLYEEPKKLVEHGLARASSEMVGKRRRTVYAITAKGRRALAEWVPTPGAGPVVEFEQLIKVFFAEHGTKADLLATLAGVREWSEERLGAGAAVPQAYLDGKGPFPDRLPWLLLVGQFLIDFHLMVERWSDWAGDIVETWPDDVGPRRRIGKRSSDKRASPPPTSANPDARVGRSRFPPGRARPSGKR